MAGLKNRLEARWLDAALHLLDRQVVDREGLMVCNVDDLELAEDGDHGLSVTGILVGPAALWPRLSGVLGDALRRTWLRLGVQYADRDVPAYIGLELVDEIGAAVTLTVDREGLLRIQPAAEAGEQHHRVGDLVGMEVRGPGEARPGRVLDVRLAPKGSRTARRLEVTHLVVGRSRPGTLLGYERGDFNGPWLVHHAVKYLHRNTGLLPIAGVTSIDWEDHHLAADRGLEPLAGV
jgi:hypothetical protein